MAEEKIILEGKQAKPLVLAAIGCPYFLIVQQETKNGTKNYSHVSAGFDLGAVFDWLKNYADTDAEFRAALSNFIIDLTQKV